MRVLHLAPRASERGGADWNLLGILAALHSEHDQLLAAGGIDAQLELPCPAELVAPLGAREAQPVEAALETLARRFAPDVIHVHNVVNAAVLRWAAGHPALVTVQDHRFFCPGQGKWTREGDICRRAMDLPTCRPCFDARAEDYFERVYAFTQQRLEALAALPVTVLSQYMRNELVQAGLPCQRVHVIAPFVHGLDRQAQPAGPPCVLMAGRLTRSKGIDDAIAAWQRSGLRLPLLFAGSGPERDRLRRAGHQLLGWVPHRALSSLYKRAVVLLLPSRWQEPFGIVGLEALSVGCPVAAYDSGGVAEWHPGPGLVDWGDVDALGEAAAALAGQRAGEPAGFDAATQMQRLKRLYRAIAGGNENNELSL